jgi:hypothetical protein
MKPARDDAANTERLSALASTLRRCIDVRDRTAPGVLLHRVQHTTFLAADALTWLAGSRFSADTAYGGAPASPRGSPARTAAAVRMLDALVRDRLVRVIWGHRRLPSGIDDRTILCRFAVDEVDEWATPTSPPSGPAVEDAAPPVWHIDPAKAALLAAGSRAAASGSIPWWLVDGVLVPRSGGDALVIDDERGGTSSLITDHTRWRFPGHTATNSVALTLSLADAQRGASHALAVCTAAQAMVVAYARAMWASLGHVEKELAMGKATASLAALRAGDGSGRGAARAAVVTAAIAGLAELAPGLQPRIEGLLVPALACSAGSACPPSPTGGERRLGAPR